MKKSWKFVCALAALSASVFTLSLLAREQIDEQPASEFGSAMAKAHPKQARAMLTAVKNLWDIRATTEKTTGREMFPSNEDFYAWSRRMLVAERALANSQQEDLAALDGYWNRTSQRYLRIKALHSTGTKGGEQETLNMAKYYLAEAELWLVAAGGTVPEEKVD